MALDPSEAHALDQLQARLREVARICASYRRELQDDGYSEAEAFASAQQLESKFCDRLLAAWEKPYELRALERVMDELDAERGRREM